MRHTAQRKKASAVVGLPSATPARNMDSLELSIAARANAQVRVLADGSLLYGAALPVARNVQFSANDKFEVTGAASAVLLPLNGQLGLYPIECPHLRYNPLDVENLGQASQWNHSTLKFWKNCAKGVRAAKKS